MRFDCFGESRRLTCKITPENGRRADVTASARAIVYCPPIGSLVVFEVTLVELGCLLLRGCDVNSATECGLVGLKRCVADM